MTPLLELEHVTYTYHSKNGEVCALSDISFQIQKAEFVAVVGPSGCGKSTLLKSLNRMNDLVEGCKITGELLLDGEDIYGTMDVNLLRKRVGWYFRSRIRFR